MLLFISYFLATWLGSISTYSLTQRFKLSPVLASASCGLILALVLALLQPLLGFELVKTLTLIEFGGSFIGMSNNRILKNNWEVSLASLLFAIIFLGTTHILTGLGGGLGFKASLSVISVYGFLYIFKELKLRTRLNQ